MSNKCIDLVKWNNCIWQKPFIPDRKMDFVGPSSSDEVQLILSI